MAIDNEDSLNIDIEDNSESLHKIMLEQQMLAKKIRKEKCKKKGRPVMPLGPQFFCEDHTCMPPKPALFRCDTKSIGCGKMSCAQHTTVFKKDQHKGMPAL